ncbi:YheC/YheD family protein [Cytobacillus horneckiae]|uniref:YheC/YheD family endospore coat-associated protein n=1 Tax=Cytobacillus horneckiae TaxID=549687 RepID=UPI0034CD361C
MNVFYDRQNNQWHSLDGALLGSNLLPTMKVQKPDSSWLHFHLQINNHFAGPIIGILTSKGRKESFAGNGPLFLSLQKEVQKNNGLTIIFTSDDIINERSISGFVFMQNQNKWVAVTAPLPHIVYNRIPFRRDENTDSFRKARAFFSKNEIPFFNPNFLNKDRLFEVLKTSNKIKPLLPEIININKKDGLYQFLIKMQKIYLKPANGAKGKGIYLLTMQENDELSLAGTNDTISFTSFEQFWNEWKNKMDTYEYLAQKAIDPVLYNGFRYDFRVLAHFNGNNHEVTGVGIRQSQTQQITTHIPHGGKLIPYEKFQTDYLDQFFKEIVSEIGNVLSKHLGVFGEFSIDTGLSKDGCYYIYEVNSKPMIFDENEIEIKRIQRLTQLCLALSGFK